MSRSRSSLAPWERSRESTTVTLFLLADAMGSNLRKNKPAHAN
jgi:hypothetical protein